MERSPALLLGCLLAGAALAGPSAQVVASPAPIEERLLPYGEPARATEAPTPPVLTPRESSHAPSEAISRLLEGKISSLSPTERGHLTRLDSLDTSLAQSITRIVDTYRELHNASQRTWGASQPPASWVREVRASQTLLVQETRQLLDASRQADQPSPLASLDLCPTMALDLEGNDSFYPADCGLILDVGGDDVYENNAGGAQGPGSCRTGSASFLLSAAAVLDLRGDDRYGSAAAPRDCGANGGAYQAAGFLLDVHGNDTYTAGRWGVNGGAATEGVGALLDLGGNDTYRAMHSGANGGATSGEGLLLDRQGDDRYEGSLRPRWSRLATGNLDQNHASQATVSSGTGASPDQVLVGLDEQVPLSPGDPVFGGTVHAVDRDLNVAKLETPDIERTRTLALKNPHVSYVEPNGRLQLHGMVPSDPLFTSQYGPQQISAPGAWQTVGEMNSTSICIPDVGFDVDHQDLQGSWEAGENFVSSGSDPSPEPNLHGTHVAGIAAAVRDNGKGIAGTSSADILGAKVGSERGPNHWALHEAIMWCADEGADVLSMSLGGFPSRTLDRAIDYAWERDVLLIASAGNEGCLGCVHYPASSPKVMAVGCTDATRTRCGFGSHGIELEVAAPGAGILSTLPDDGYGNLSGTSMSAPMVAGVAAMVREVRPALTNEEVRTVLRDTATDVGSPGCDLATGVGEVNATRAVQRAQTLTRPAEPERVCPTGHRGFNGGATSGTGSLVDLEGDDRYQAGHRGTNGGGMNGGAGRLVDASGDDRYAAGARAVNGAGTGLGTGLLMDGTGNDSYEDSQESKQDETTVPKGTTGGQVDGSDPLAWITNGRFAPRLDGPDLARWGVLP